MRIGVAGLGFMGGTHLRAYRKIARAEVVAVASSDAKKLAGDRSGPRGNLEQSSEPLDLGEAARYRTAKELIADPAVEAVDLCVPSYLHATLALAALQAGKHVLVEKPMALSAGDCDAMIEASQESNRVLMVAQVLRFWPEYVEARRRVLSGELGAVRAASFRRKCAAPAWSPWMRDRAKSGGGIFDLLIHDVDFALHLLGKPKAVTALGVEDLANGLDVVDARFEYESGIPVSISGGWYLPSEYPFSMEFSIVLDGGTLDFHSAHRRLTLYRKGGPAVELPLPASDAFQSELEAFVAACERGSGPKECRPEDSSLATRMALAMRMSRDHGGLRLAL
jgi:predicted dehydrogenase